MPVLNDKIVVHQVASGQDYVNSAFFLEVIALHCIPILLLKCVSTSISLFACFSDMNTTTDFVYLVYSSNEISIVYTDLSIPVVYLRCFTLRSDLTCWPPNQILLVNTLRLRQNGRHFADDTFKRIFLNNNIIISIKISLKFVPKGPINNIPALV